MWSGKADALPVCAVVASRPTNGERAWFGGLGIGVSAGPVGMGQNCVGEGTGGDWLWGSNLQHGQALQIDRAEDGPLCRHLQGEAKRFKD